MSITYKCTPLNDSEQTLLTSFAALNLEQKKYVLENFPAPKLLPKEKQAEYFKEILTDKRFDKCSVNPSKDLVDLPNPFDKQKWSDIESFKRLLTIFVVGVSSLTEENRVSALMLLVDEFEIQRSDAGIKSVKMLLRGKECMILATDYPSRSWSWQATFPGSVDKNPFRLGNNIQVFLDKDQVLKDKVFKTDLPSS